MLFLSFVPNLISEKKQNRIFFFVSHANTFQIELIIFLIFLVLPSWARKNINYTIVNISSERCKKGVEKWNKRERPVVSQAWETLESSLHEYQKNLFPFSHFLHSARRKHRKRLKSRFDNDLRLLWSGCWTEFEFWWSELFFFQFRTFWRVLKKFKIKWFNKIIPWNWITSSNIFEF